MSFLETGFMARLDQERGFVYRDSKTPAYGWMGQFNSLGGIMPEIDLIWDAWWSFGYSQTSHVAAIQYFSGLMYFEGENPLFGKWNPKSGGGGPWLWENDALIPLRWLPENVAFLQKTLSAQFVADKLGEAVSLLAGEPEHQQAKHVESDLDQYMEIINSRVKELPSLLADPRLEKWTI